MVKKTELNKIPRNSGVYLFKNKNKQILYIGKAKNLKNRISSYFKKDIWFLTPSKKALFIFSEKNSTLKLGSVEFSN